MCPRSDSGNKHTKWWKEKKNSERLHEKRIRGGGWGGKERVKGLKYKDTKLCKDVYSANHLWPCQSNNHVKEASETGHCGDWLPYLGHHKEALRLANKETSLSTEDEVIAAVKGRPEAGGMRKRGRKEGRGRGEGMKERKWDRDWEKKRGGRRESVRVVQTRKASERTRTNSPRGTLIQDLI